MVGWVLLKERKEVGGKGHKVKCGWDLHFPRISFNRVTVG